MSNVTQNITYKKILIKFMSFRDGVTYDTNHSFSAAELNQINPDEICSYMSLKCYNSTNPTEITRPIHMRSSTLCFWINGVKIMSSPEFGGLCRND